MQVGLPHVAAIVWCRRVSHCPYDPDDRCNYQKLASQLPRKRIESVQV